MNKPKTKELLIPNNSSDIGLIDALKVKTLKLALYLQYDQNINMSALVLTLLMIYSKTCLKRPLKNRQDKCLNGKW